VSVSGLQKRLGHVGVWSGNTRSWARPRQRAWAVGGDISDRRGPCNRENDKRWGNRANERGLRDRERMLTCMEETGANKSAPPGSERE
jgi:hypothetical protein